MDSTPTNFITHEQAQTFGDQRYNYTLFDNLAEGDKIIVRTWAYPYKSIFLDHHYWYPVNKKGQLVSGRRVLAIAREALDDRNAMVSLGYSKEWVEQNVGGGVVEP